jgi:hypothetical protein
MGVTLSTTPSSTPLGQILALLANRSLAATRPSGARERIPQRFAKDQAVFATATSAHDLREAHRGSMSDSRSREQHPIPFLLRWGAAALSVAEPWYR